MKKEEEYSSKVFLGTEVWHGIETLQCHYRKGKGGYEISIADNTRVVHIFGEDYDKHSTEHSLKKLDVLIKELSKLREEFVKKNLEHLKNKTR